MNANERVYREIYENLISEIGESLLEVYDALWIYDFEKALKIVNRTINTINSRLREVRLTGELLINKARHIRKEIGKRLLEAPGHEITVLAPIIARLIQIREQVYQMLQLWNENSIKSLRYLKQCIILDIDEVYLA